MKSFKGIAMVLKQLAAVSSALGLLFRVLLFVSIYLTASIEMPASTDSLEKAAPKAPDNKKPEIYNNLAKAYQNISAVKSNKYSHLALQFSQKAGDRKNESAAYFNLGINSVSFNKIAEAADYFRRSLEIRQALGDKPLIASSYNALGNVTRLAGNNQQALEYYFKSLEIRKALGDNLMIAATYNNIGIVYKFWGKFEKALEYYLFSLKYSEAAGDTSIIIPSLINIGNIYSEMKDYRRSLDYYFKVLEISQKINNLAEVASAYNSIGTSYNYMNDFVKAIQYFNSSYQMAQQTGNIATQSNALNNLGESYHRMKQFDTALKYYELSAALSTPGEDLFSNATSLNNIGAIYRSKGEYKKALEYLLKSMEINNQHNNINTLVDNYINLALVYEGLGDYKKAFQYYRLFSETKDTLASESVNKRIYEIQMKYETDKKQKEIELLKREKEKESAINDYLYALLAMGTLLIIVVLVMFLIKLRANKTLAQKNELIIAQKDRLAKTLEDLNRTNEANERYLSILSEELARASDYVISLIPAEIKTGSIKTQWMLKPSSKLGGDTLGYHWLDSENLAIYLLDVSGHGVGASLHAISILNTIKYQNLKNTDFKHPEQVLHSLNKAFQMREHNNLFCTFWYGVYNKSTRELKYASAGHPPAFLLNGSGSVNQLYTKNFVIGGTRQYDFVSSSVKLKPHSRLFVFSDGVYEIWDENGNIWSINDLKDFIAGQPAEEGNEIKSLYHHVIEYHRNETLDDDFSILKVIFD